MGFSGTPTSSLLAASVGRADSTVRDQLLTLPGVADDPAELVQPADIAMYSAATYSAKAMGGNTVVFHQAPHSASNAG